MRTSSLAALLCLLILSVYSPAASSDASTEELLYRPGRRPLVGVYYLNVFSEQFFINPFKKPFSSLEPVNHKPVTVLPEKGVKEFWAGVYDLKHKTDTAIHRAFGEQNLDFSKLEPVVGYYDLADYETSGSAMTTMEKHIVQAHRGGLDFFNFYWYFNNLKWRETKATRPWCLPSSPHYPGIAKSANCHLSDILYNPDAIESFVRARNAEQHNFKFMISIYADHWAVNWDINEHNLNDVVSHLGHLFKNPNYVKVDGRPVLFIGNGSGILVGIDAFIQALNWKISPQPIVLVGPSHRNDNNSEQNIPILAARYQSIIDAISAMPQYEANYLWKSSNMISFRDISGFPFANVNSCARDSLLCPLKKYLSRCEFKGSVNNPNIVKKVEDFVGRVINLSDEDIDSSCSKLSATGGPWLLLLKNYVKALKINHFEQSLISRQSFQKRFTESNTEARALRVGTLHQGYSCLWPTELGSEYVEENGKPIMNERNARYQNGRPLYRYFVDTEIDTHLKKWSDDPKKPLAPCMAHEVDERPELTTWKRGDNEYQLRYFPDFSSDKFRKGLQKVRDWQIKQTHPLSEILSIYAWNEWQEGGRLEPNTRDHTAWLDLIQSVTRTVPLIRYTSSKEGIHRITTLPPESEKLPKGEEWKEEMRWLIFDESKPGQERIPLYECRKGENGPFFISGYADCEGKKHVGLLGYVLKRIPDAPKEGDYKTYWSRPEWLAPLYRCIAELPKPHHFVSSYEDCEVSQSPGNPYRIRKGLASPIGYAIREQKNDAGNWKIPK